MKALPYAKSGITDYWILDVNQRKLHVYRLPSPDGYQSETILSFICDNFTAGIWCYSDRSAGIIATYKLIKCQVLLSPRKNTVDNPKTETGVVIETRVEEIDTVRRTAAIRTVVPRTTAQEM